MQFERDIAEYHKAEDQDEEKLNEYENKQVEAEDLADDIEHYLGVVKYQLQQCQRQIKQERNTEEKRLQIKAEEKEKKQQFELQKYEMEMERRKQKQQYELERLRLESDVEKEKWKTCLLYTSPSPRDS